MQAQTSIFAYIEEQQAGKIAPLQQKILDLLQLYPSGLNNRMIADKSGIAINVVTPRVKELREAGKVRMLKIDRDPITGKSTMFWGAV